MNTRDFILVGVGAIAGYLLVGIVNKNKANSTTGLPDSSAQTLPPATVGGESVVDPRLTLCEDNWIKYSETMRFGSTEQAQTTRDNFITNCLAKA